uniref:NADH-ubiquinone oxidoreductase chain 2 n=1 Tax=Champsodon cf. snyderi CBM-ZF 10876 TaxID=270612 RepID=T2HU66_9TELE|nr:NADH dehydrogenase subunit 2 [Champsodon cf. snyderi CBM-ZF 10876]BAN83374.1 NADH dehydrogenase subunit 2 [Champsodon cf. snyderi CBM-ZF 10876]
MPPMVLILMMLTIGLGTLITVTSSHWLLAWMGLELNTLAIIPIMAHRHHPRAAEAATKYFLAQATAAAMLLFSTIINAWMTGQWCIGQQMSALPHTMIILALALKIGLAPLHSWLPEVLQGLDLSTGLLLSTWQKLAPFSLLLQLQPQDHPLFLIIGLISVLVGGWGGLNQIQLRKILAYSSITHMGWMIMVMQFSPPLAMLTLLTYIIMTTSAFLLFKLKKTYSINQLASSWTMFPALTAMTPLVLLSLGGLPPLTGFMPKWLILQELTTQALTPLATLMAMSALFSLYFYLRLSYSMTLTMFPHNMLAAAPWRLNPPNNNSLITAYMTMTTALMLPMAPTTMTLLTY